MTRDRTPGAANPAPADRERTRPGIRAARRSRIGRPGAATVGALVALVASSAGADEPGLPPPAPATAAEPIAAPGQADAAFRPPRLLRFVEATAPPALAARGTAEVILLLDVDVTGRVISVQVTRPAGDGFDEAAVEAARQFVFEPGTRDGRPVPTRVTYRYRFLQRQVATPAPAADAASTAPLAGTVLNRGDRVPLVGVAVSLDGGEPSTLSDGQGRFAFDAVPVGPHVIHLRGAVTGRPDFPVTIKPNTRTTVTLYAYRKERYRSMVRAPRAVVETVEQTLSAEELRHIPGTQGDTIKAVQNLPGVARPPFGGGLLVVWGSAPGDTRTYVDGVYVPLLYHFSGLRSTVNSDLVQSLTFMPGGFGVDYGRGLGGVIEVEGRRPRSDGYHGFAQIDLIDLSAMVEGPIAKNAEFAAAGRVSWLHLFLPAFLTSDVQASPKYWDYQARLHFRPTPRDDIDLFAFGSDDTLNLILKDPDPSLTMAFDTHMYFHRGLARYTHRFDGGATLSVTPSVGYDRPYNVGFEYGALPFKTDMGQLSYNLRAVARAPVNPWVRFDVGLDYEGTRFTYDSTQNVAGPLRDGDNGGFGGLAGPDTALAVATDHMLLYTNHVAPYVRMDVALFGRKLTVSGQFRLELMTFWGYPGTPREFHAEQLLPEPRLALRWQIHPRFGLRAAIGMYHQAPDSQDFSAVFGSRWLLPQFGMHYVAGAELQFTSTLRIEAQGFYKELRDLVVRARHPGPGDDQQLMTDGIGRIYGGELLVRQELWKNLFGWVSYTVVRSERQDHPGDPWRRFQYDQTHILTVLASYKLPLGFQVGLRYRYATGNPYTPPVGSFYDANSNSYVPIWGPTYSARLPAFNQLDLRVDKTFTFDRWKFVAYLDIENVYAAQNAEAAMFNYNFTRTGFVSGLPLLPVIGLRGEF